MAMSLEATTTSTGVTSKSPRAGLAVVIANPWAVFVVVATVAALPNGETITLATGTDAGPTDTIQSLTNTSGATKTAVVQTPPFVSFGDGTSDDNATVWFTSTASVDVRFDSFLLAGAVSESP